jgi:HlyD family secretion protein
MKNWKLIGGILIILILALQVTACGSPDDQSRPLQKTTVMRGELITYVTGSGKIAVVNDAKLSFATGGKLTTLNVKEGDKVNQGEVLAKLETDTLELALSQAQVAQAQAQVAFTQVQIAQTQADIALTSAQFNLDRTKAVSEIEDKITKARMDLEIAQQMQAEESHLYSDNEGVQYWATRIPQLKADLLQKQQDLAELLSKDEFIGQFLYLSGQKYDRLVVEDVRIKQSQVTAAQQAVQQAILSVNQAKLVTDQAAKAVVVAQNQLNNATITAPFNGTVATIYYKKGDLIPSPVAAPQIIIYIVDPDHLEMDTSINETDILAVQVGQSAEIKVDVLQGVTLKGEVSSLAAIPNAQAAAAGTTSYIAKITFSVPQGLSVKPGLNADVNIMTSDLKSVLLLSSEAVKQDKQGNTYVQVVNNQQIKDQPVVTGAHDTVNTEIVSGLKEGDQVVAGVAWSFQGK